MKKFITNPNVQAAILLLVAIAEIVVAAIYKPITVKLISGFVILSLLSVVLVRFAYPIAKWHNQVHTFFHRKNSTEGDDEPSEFSVIMMKVAGYLLLAVQTFLVIFICVI